MEGTTRNADCTATARREPITRRYTIGSASEVGKDVEMTTMSGKKKRFRKAYSCRNCRHRKIKCDRVFPCQQCHLRGIHTSCGGDTLFKDYANTDERKRKYMRHDDEMQMRAMRSRSSSDGTNPISDLSERKAKECDEATLDTLYKSLDTFRGYISHIEQKFGLRNAPSSSFSANSRTHVRRNTHAAASKDIESSQDCDQEVRGDLVLRQIKILDDKINAIYSKIADLNVAPSQGDLVESSTSTQPTPTSFSSAQCSSICPQNDAYYLDEISLTTMHSAEDCNMDMAIDRWLEEEYMPLMPTIDPIISQRNLTLSPDPSYLPSMHRKGHLPNS